MESVTVQLRDLGALPQALGGGGVLPPASVGAAQGGVLPPAAIRAHGAADKVSPHVPPLSPDKLESLRRLQSEFQAVQGMAFQIGRESDDNEALAGHPKLNEYVMKLRSFEPRLQSTLVDFERELSSRSAVQPSDNKAKKRKSTNKSKSNVFSQEVIQYRVKSQLAKDDRPFRTQALDAISLFRERQLQMQDKQGDMQRTMDGPDWPKEDWPLTSADAKAVGEAETTIQALLAVLSANLDKIGGLARAHETEDWSNLEQISVLSEMMLSYVDIIDRHVDTVKKSQNVKKKRALAASRTNPGGIGVLGKSADLGGASLGGGPALSGGLYGGSGGLSGGSFGVAGSFHGGLGGAASGFGAASMQKTSEGDRNSGVFVSGSPSAGFGSSFGNLGGVGAGGSLGKLGGANAFGSFSATSQAGANAFGATGAVGGGFVAASGSAPALGHGAPAFGGGRSASIPGSGSFGGGFAGAASGAAGANNLGNLGAIGTGGLGGSFLGGLGGLGTLRSSLGGGLGAGAEL